VREFKSASQAERLGSAHAAVSNLSNLGKLLAGSEHDRNLRMFAFGCMVLVGGIKTCPCFFEAQWSLFFEIRLIDHAQ
jgi:hypothetical protein